MHCLHSQLSLIINTLFLLFTASLIPSLTHLFPHLPCHLFCHKRSHSSIYLNIHSVPQSLTRSLQHSVTHSLIHCISLPLHLPLNWLHSLFPLCTHSITPSSILILSLLHSFFHFKYQTRFFTFIHCLMPSFFFPSFIHPFIYVIIHRFIHALTYWLIHSFHTALPHSIHSFIIYFFLSLLHLQIYWLVSFLKSLNHCYTLIYLFIHSTFQYPLISSLTHSSLFSYKHCHPSHSHLTILSWFTPLLIYLLFHFLIHPLTHPVTRPLTHSLGQSPTHSLT